VASDTKNVKLGVCQVFYKGTDLGYTQGGVQVTVATQTHKVNIDQFGKSTVNEIVMSRDVSVKVPLAETTLENLVNTMPGAALSETGGTAASGLITVNSLPTAGEKLVVDGVAFTFKAAASSPSEISIGATTADTATAIAAALSASKIPAVSESSYVAAASAVTVTHNEVGTNGNTVTLATTSAGITLSGARLSGGVDATEKHVIVTSGIGVDLLSIAGELRLHPKGKAADDYSEDFVIPLAATAGGMNFAYEVEKERIFDTTFTGYPDPVSQELFAIGVAPA
jgi:hypothetical protein